MGRGPWEGAVAAGGQSRTLESEGWVQDGERSTTWLNATKEYVPLCDGIVEPLDAPSQQKSGEKRSLK